MNTLVLSVVVYLVAVLLDVSSTAYIIFNGIGVEVNPMLKSVLFTPLHILYEVLAFTVIIILTFIARAFHSKYYIIVLVASSVRLYGFINNICLVIGKIG